MTSVADILGADGAAGDPGTLHQAALACEHGAAHASEFVTRLRAFDAASWRSAARYRFDELKDERVVGQLEPIVRGLEAASEILHHYARELDQLQARARSLAVAMNGAAETELGREAQVSSADRVVHLATTAEHLTSSVPGLRDLAHHELANAQRNQAAAQQQLAAARRESQRLRGIGQDLRHELDAAAARAASALEAVHAPAADQVALAAVPATIAIGAVATAADLPVRLLRRQSPVPESALERGEAIRDARIDRQERDRWNATPLPRQGKQNFDSARIVDEANKWVAEQRAAHPGQPVWGGQCLWWVTQIIGRAGGKAGPFGLNTSTYAGQWSKWGNRIDDHRALMPGDVLQWPATKDHQPHTAIVVTGGPNPQIIDSNSDLHEHVMGPHAITNPRPYEAWRVGKVY